MGTSSLYKKLQNEATCIDLLLSHLLTAAVLVRLTSSSPIILVHFSSRSCGEGKSSRLVRLTPLYPLSTCTMTGRIWTTPGTSNPPKTTITQETTVTYSKIENNVERVNVCVLH